MRESMTASQRLVSYFEYDHLPAHLQSVARDCKILAESMENSLPNGPEKTTGLRKLLEAKDLLRSGRIRRMTAPTLLVGISHYRYPMNVKKDKRILHYASYENDTLPICGVAGSFVACDPAWTVLYGFRLCSRCHAGLPSHYNKGLHPEIAKQLRERNLL